MVKKKETLLNSSVGAPIEVSQGQEFYRPRQVAELLGISMRTYYTMVSRGKLHPVKLSERVTVVARKEIFNMVEAAIGVELSRSIFSNGKRHVTGKGNGKESGKADNQQATKKTARDRAPVGVTHDTHYTMAEVCAKFDYSYGRLYTLRMRYQIPAVHAFGTTCYPKDAIDKAMSEERERLGKT
ncbi:MAG: helix-turn-helix transcriptional regulator, partial [Prevotella sp.]